VKCCIGILYKGRELAIDYLRVFFSRSDVEGRFLRIILNIKDWKGTRENAVEVKSTKAYVKMANLSLVFSWTAILKSVVGDGESGCHLNGTQYIL
jgi:hypothetical protein